MTQALKYRPREEIGIIGQGMEKYLTLRLGDRLVFKDSYMFLGSSLQTLGNNLLKAGIDKFVQLKTQIPGVSDEQLRLLVGKGVYPYEYMTNYEHFKDHLPLNEEFFSNLHNADITDADYADAQAVWNAFNIRTLGQYHYLYLKSIFPCIFHYQHIALMNYMHACCTYHINLK